MKSIPVWLSSWGISGFHGAALVVACAACGAVSAEERGEGDEGGGSLGAPPPVGSAVDLNGDGIADGQAVDSNGDGIADGVDTTGDGVADMPLPVTTPGTGGGVSGTGGLAAGTGGTTSTGGGGPVLPADGDVFYFYHEGSVTKYFDWTASTSANISASDASDGSLSVTVTNPADDRNAASQGFGWFVDAEDEAAQLDASEFQSIKFNVNTGENTELALVVFSGAPVTENSLWAPFAWPTPTWVGSGVGEFDYYAIPKSTNGEVAISFANSLPRVRTDRLRKIQFVVVGEGPVSINHVRLEKDEVALEARSGNKFDPGQGKTYLLIGQETAGIENYENSSMPEPAGHMHYMAALDGWYGYEGSAIPGEPDRGEYRTTHFWDDNYSRYSNRMAQIGLSTWNGSGGGCSQIASSSGPLSDQSAYEAARVLFLLEARLKSSRRPVLLRVGYEFDNPDHNCGSASDYQQAFRRIVDYLRSKNVTNVAYVFHPFTQLKNDNLDSYWPGDDYVDWVGASVFTAPGGAGAQQGYLADNVMHVLDYANHRNKPLMIAESSPTNYNGGHPSGVIDGSAMNNWFGYLFDFMESANGFNTGGNVRAFSYIHSNWSSFPFWQAQGGGVWINTEIPSDQQANFSANITSPSNGHHYVTGAQISFSPSDPGGTFSVD